MKFEWENSCVPYLNLKTLKSSHRPIPSDILIDKITELKTTSTEARDRIQQLENIFILFSDEQFPTGAFGSGAGGCSAAQIGTKYRKQRKFSEVVQAILVRTSGNICI